jgi:hypothetical protein
LLEEHLIYQDTKGPPIDGSAIFLVQEDLIWTRSAAAPPDAVVVSTHLWRHELGSTAESAGGRTEPHVFFAETVICDLDVAIEGQKNVVEFEITVDDAVLMEVL